MMPDFEFTNPEGKRFTVTGLQGATPEQAWTVLQQHLTGGGHHDVGPADWGAVPAEPEGFSTSRSMIALRRRQIALSGFVGAYIDRIRNMPDRSNVAGKIMNSPNAREQIEIALGRQRANELQTFTHVENIMDAARNAVQGNSTTARQLVELGLAGGFGGLETGNNPFTDPEAFMHSALVFGALRGHAKIDERVSRQVARLLTSNDLSKVNTGIKILSQHPSLSNSVRHADAAISSVLACGSLPATE